MGIKEKDLQTVNSIEGGKLRCVTANGESRNIDANAFGGIEIVQVTVQQNNGVVVGAEASSSFEEVLEAIRQNKMVVSRVCILENWASVPMAYTWLVASSPYEYADYTKSVGFYGVYGSRAGQVVKLRYWTVLITEDGVTFNEWTTE
jgi:hypothetical protein